MTTENCLTDEMFIKKTLIIAQRSVDNNNQPFGALMVNEKNEIINTAENTELTEDLTGHAEINLIRKVSKMKLSQEEINKLTLYTSTEPCAMCAAVISKFKISKVVYGCSAKRMSQIIHGDTPKVKRQVPIIGPILEEQATIIHEKYWPKQ